MTQILVFIPDHSFWFASGSSLCIDHQICQDFEGRQKQVAKNGADVVDIRQW